MGQPGHGEHSGKDDSGISGWMPGKYASVSRACCRRPCGKKPSADLKDDFVLNLVLQRQIVVLLYNIYLGDSDREGTAHPCSVQM